MEKWCNKPIPNIEKSVVIPIPIIANCEAELVLAKALHKSKMEMQKLIAKYHIKVKRCSRKTFRRNYGKH